MKNSPCFRTYIPPKLDHFKLVNAIVCLFVSSISHTYVQFEIRTSEKCATERDTVTKVVHEYTESKICVVVFSVIFVNQSKCS